MAPPFQEDEVASLTASNAALLTELYRSWEAHSITQAALTVLMERLQWARAETEQCRDELRDSRAAVERLSNQLSIYEASSAVAAAAAPAAHNINRDPSASPSPDTAASDAASPPEP